MLTQPSARKHTDVTRLSVAPSNVWRRLHGACNSRNFSRFLKTGPAAIFVQHFQR